MKQKSKTVGRAVLEGQVHQAKSRLVELQRQRAVVEDGSYRAQELASEEIDTRRLRDIAAAKLNHVDAPNTMEADQREMFNRLVEERTQLTLEWIAKLEREGDHRQARIWRLALLDIPAQVAREM